MFIKYFIILVLGIFLIFFTKNKLSYDYLNKTPNSVVNIENSIFANQLKNSKLLSNQLSKKVIILHFWASWCAPCVSEFSDLNNLLSTQSINKDFIFIIVSLDQDVKDRDRFLINFKSISKFVDLNLLDESSKIFSEFSGEKLPVTYVIKNFSIQRSYIGASDWISVFKTAKDLSNAK